MFWNNLCLFVLCWNFECKIYFIRRFLMTSLFLWVTLEYSCCLQGVSAFLIGNIPVVELLQLNVTQLHYFLKLLVLKKKKKNETHRGHLKTLPPKLKGGTKILRNHSAASKTGSFDWCRKTWEGWALRTEPISLSLEQTLGTEEPARSLQVFLGFSVLSPRWSSPNKMLTEGFKTFFSSPSKFGSSTSPNYSISWALGLEGFS